MKSIAEINSIKIQWDYKYGFFYSLTLIDFLTVNHLDGKDYLILETSNKEILC